MGKQAITIAEYDQDGKYIQEYASATEARAKYYDSPTLPLWDKHEKIHFLENGSYLTKGRVGRDYIKNECIKLNDPYRIKKRGQINEQQVEVYNFSGVLIATFVNSYIAGLMLNIKPSLIQYRCKHESKEYHNNNKLHFKFKTN